MTCKIKVTCESCGVTGTLDLGMNVKTLNVGGVIKVENPCPNCGNAAMSAPGGKYELDDNGNLNRTGDFEGPA
ncbi:UNVERIFIED_ORG: putative RNA-binding Zn-ribbon protein involved in translation (DUF1610 family) [Sphingomonas sp. R1F5B]